MHQLRSIQRALDRIEKLLTEPLNVETLAREAGMSHWHFQRTFSAMIGEPVGRYVRRRRLSVATARLSESDRSILDIALEFQFESHEAFTRAFKSEFGITPSQWRTCLHAPSKIRQKEPLSTLTLHQRFQHMNLTPEIVTLPARSYLGLQTTFISAVSSEANNLQVIPRLWDDFFQRAGEIQSAEPGVFFGLCENLESRNVKRTHPDEVLYLAATPVAPDAQVPDGMTVWNAPGGEFAKFVHKGRVEGIGQTIGYIYGKWLPESEFKQGDGPDLERYDHRFDPTSDESVLEIFVPIQC